MVTSRIWFTAAQKAELWERWKNGQSAAAISRALERKNKTGVERIVALHRGIVPAPRRRALAALRLEEREEISRGIAVGRSIRQIAEGLGWAPSTVSREIRRNGGGQAYRANRAVQCPVLSLGGGDETARIYYLARWSDCRLATCRTRAASRSGAAHRPSEFLSRNGFWTAKLGIRRSAWDLPNWDGSKAATFTSTIAGLPVMWIACTRWPTSSLASSPK